MSLHDLSSYFDKDYFENGIKKGLSLYENYRWIPQISFERAIVIKDMFANKSILDFGCAKGFIVHALRMMNVEAYGYDISEYAICNCKEDVKDYVFINRDDVPDVDVVIGKDVLEHIPYESINKELEWIHSKCQYAFFILPFGEDSKYRIAEYGYDKTHKIIENEEWWLNLFRKCGFKLVNFSYNIVGIKDRWSNHDKYGNGFFTLEKII